MPTAKNRFQILNLDTQKKKLAFKKKERTFIHAPKLDNFHLVCFNNCNFGSFNETTLIWIFTQARMVIEYIL